MACSKCCLAAVDEQCVDAGGIRPFPAQHRSVGVGAQRGEAVHNRCRGWRDGGRICLDVWSGAAGEGRRQAAPEGQKSDRTQKQGYLPGGPNALMRSWAGGDLQRSRCVECGQGQERQSGTPIGGVCVPERRGH
jgi:hypothetical protein